ncbi:MAG: YdjY domain-containing protein [Planctomycetaceae bacterium]
MSVSRLLLLLSALGPAFANAAEQPKPATSPAGQVEPDAQKKPTPLNKQETVFLDLAKKQLVLKARVCLRAGPLEMLLCKAQTKEHEAILAVNSDAFTIHGGLLALGIQAGSPVRYEPQFQAPTGPRVKVTLTWQDAEGKTHTVPAQSWVRGAIYRYFSFPLSQLPQGFKLPKDSELRYDEMNQELLWFGPMSSAQKDDLLSLSQDAQYRKGIAHFFDRSQSREMEADWVFAGSGFYINGDGTKYYQAEDGNVICVANFGDALLDVTVRSSASNDGLQFEAWTDRIPPVDTPVDVTLTPIPDPPPAAPKTPTAAPPTPQK